MGTAQSNPVGIGAHSTAKEVVENFGEGKYLAGKTAIVTGGNSGIGLEATKALAYAGARVIMCCRSVKAGQAAIDSEITQPGNGGYVVDAQNIVVKALELNSLASIKAFATDFLATESRLDFLVLNAGIMALPNKEFTDDGFERQIGVNHFGHFYLTQLLKEKLLTTPNTAGRIVALSSSAHNMGKVLPSDLHYTKGRPYKGWEAYGQSKLANLLFAKGLADRLKGTPATAVAVHPGIIHTNLWNASLFNKVLGNFIASKTIPQGAATTVYACVCPGIGTDANRGAYLEDCRLSQPTVADGVDADSSLRNALWSATEEQLAAAVKKANL
uniref:Uncharacterized protein n=1 Tax=Spumella elongata TaxID=89044 RepID=A0A7S3H494_9STRA|mmetsp:Transcript_34361/g.59099  ORF Transcript_34361/g.59099 Transcript_34361/m.59099 type:complete len:329 (+) Transcript_34361:24-1010(+)|eukprot:CAMPEP_0184970672 /NCGR_PEP_ID=MMETSP1098-20130426/3058_1 /TAXON_ID=89044 /ORGANISM="Spumella elongata, Strain CCAP 955/1" /LENGTH=328 /DNA_ID=CAMNT_0027492635 /DNA_START=26 /DNA_END=1012 /DNA_ORIENTATION=-